MDRYLMDKYRRLRLNIPFRGERDLKLQSCSKVMNETSEKFCGKVASLIIYSY